HMLIRLANPSVVPFLARRLPNARGYELKMMPDIRDKFTLESELDTAVVMNKVVEETVLLAPEQYMWLHRRFKTRPQGVPSRY
ncbi:lipid A biosynthesis lauroyl acyltransferase, partial [Klebsiella pneumoniae]|nr:lipid A biosynthesis lauroyl acyltransferase [Klebsiella pneumoniae]